MFKPRLHIGCNINDRSIELIIINGNTSPLVITAKARTELNPSTIQRGQIIDETAFHRAIKSIRAQAGISERETIHVTLSISEQLVFPFSVTKPAQTTPEQLNALITQEAKRKIPFDTAFQQIFIIKETVSRPVVFAYAIDKRILASYKKLLALERIIIDHIEPDGIALVRYILPDAALEQHITLIDIGTTITHIITVTNGYPVLSQHVPFGAETLRTSANMYNLTPKKVPEAIRSFAQDVTTRIRRAHEFLEQFNDAGSHTVRILGGGSLLPHISEIIEKESRAFVSPGSAAHVFATEGLSKKELPLFAHAVGSALRGTSQTVGRELLPLERLSDSTKHRFYPSLETTKKRIAAGIFAIVACIALAVVLIIVNNRQPSQGSINTTTNQTNTSSLSAIATLPVDLSDPTVASSISFQEKTGEEKTTVQTTGIHTTSGFAEGTVRMFNTSSSERPLVSGTRLSTPDGIIFKIQQDITIPAQGSFDVRVKADSEGALGNIGTGVRFSVPGLSSYNQQYTYGIAQENFTGGIKTRRTVAATDIEKAADNLTKLLIAKFQKEFAESASDVQNVALLDSQISSTTASTPEIDEESETVTITTAVRVPALFVQQDALVRIAEQHIGQAGAIQRIDLTNATYDVATKTGTATLTVYYLR